MIVAGANLLAYLVMPGERTEEAENVLSRDPHWAAPLLWRSELRSVMHTFIQRGDLTVAKAVSLLEQAAEVLGGRESEVDSRAVLTLASRSGCSTYDCEYVALAEMLDVPLVTADRAVLKAFPKRAVAPADVLAG